MAWAVSELREALDRVIEEGHSKLPVRCLGLHIGALEYDVESSGDPKWLTLLSGLDD